MKRELPFLSVKEVNEIEDYERFYYSKAYLKQKAGSLIYYKNQVAELRKLAQASGYKHFNKFIEHRKKWLEMEQKIPLAYLNTIGVKLDVLQFTVCKMLDYNCPACQIKLDRVKGIVNTHFTGDEKYMVLYQCPECQKYYLIVSMEATIGSGVNYFTFRIDLTDEEGKQIKEILEKRPPEAHDFMDEFDMKNKDRRVILEDEIERWT